jgi:hypothetical protein
MDRSRGIPGSSSSPRDSGNFPEGQRAPSLRVAAPREHAESPPTATRSKPFPAISRRVERPRSGDGLGGETLLLPDSLPSFADQHSEEGPPAPRVHKRGEVIDQSSQHDRPEPEWREPQNCKQHVNGPALLNLLLGARREETSQASAYLLSRFPHSCLAYF